MTTGAEVTRALGTARALAAMLEDPDLTGDLLAVAIALRWVLDSGDTSKWLNRVAEAIGHRPQRVRIAIGDDMPRYKGDMTSPVCDVLMPRRGDACGKRASNYTSDRDPETGALRLVGRCTRHDVDRAFWLCLEDRRKQWEANGKPLPPHDTGGILRRHFPGYNWADIYTWARPGVEQTPGGGKPKILPRPKLILLRGGAS